MCTFTLTLTYSTGTLNPNMPYNYLIEEACYKRVLLSCMLRVLRYFLRQDWGKKGLMFGNFTEERL